MEVEGRAWGWREDVREGKKRKGGGRNFWRIAPRDGRDAKVPYELFL